MPSSTAALTSPPVGPHWLPLLTTEAPVECACEVGSLGFRVMTLSSGPNGVTRANSSARQV